MSQFFSIRVIGILIGLGFTLAVLWAFGNGVVAVISEGQLKQATVEHEYHKKPNDYAWSFDGLLGKWDTQQLQRGFKVYDEVCAACHGLKFVAFRDLEQIGYDEGQVKNYAASKQVQDIDPTTRETVTRPGLPTDYFPHVAYAGAGVPPDLSLIAKARPDGTNYLVSLLTGYTEVPAELKAEFPDFAVPATGYYNPYFPNLALSMPAPLVDGQVTYDDGTEATVEQMSKDVAAFLTWTAEPTLVKRKQTGWPVLIFLLFATVLAYLSKQQIWAAVKPKKRD
ncbi:cytochrome c1 [Qipengyuania sp. 6B39]|uniref:cytochrome c1 n=1 Tax=Qipengyuania proteolytica TaxID=2867239 RepID=UPI001C895E87|nr:cytochrome c1 [Qipengyuania proteolytica]MBX7494516.1 cytochrome c1 [Qipengyuania proteolytica]